MTDLRGAAAMARRRRRRARWCGGAGCDAGRRRCPASAEPGRWARCSGCNTCSRPGWPSAARPANRSMLAWRQFLRGHGPSTLVIDATGLDARAQGSVTVLDRAPWLLAEGVLIGAGLRDSRTVELRLPAELAGHEAALLNAVDALRSLAHVEGAPRIHLDVQRDSRASCWGEGRPADGARLVHTPETWCRLALLFADATGPEASLLTLRRGMNQRGLVELARSGNLRDQIHGWGGGVGVDGQDPVLVFDDGLGGFLPLSEADLSCEPLSLASAGIIPSPSTLMVMAEGVCMVKQTGRALYRHWQLADNETSPVRGLAGPSGPPGQRDQSRSRRRRPSGRPRRNDPRAGRPGPGGGLAAGQLPAPLPPAVGRPRPARVLPGRGVPRAARRRRATAPARPTSTSPASWPISATATIGPPSKSSGTTTPCRWCAAWSARRRASPPACAAAATARCSSGP